MKHRYKKIVLHWRDCFFIAFFARASSLFLYFKKTYRLFLYIFPSLFCWTCRLDSRPWMLLFPSDVASVSLWLVTVRRVRRPSVSTLSSTRRLRETTFSTACELLKKIYAPCVMCRVLSVVFAWSCPISRFRFCSHVFFGGMGGSENLRDVRKGINGKQIYCFPVGLKLNQSINRIVWNMTEFQNLMLGKRWILSSFPYPVLD